MTNKEARDLIELELKIRGKNINHTYYSDEFYPPSDEEEKQSEKEYGVNWYTNHLFESYCGYTSGYINSALRSKNKPNTFVINYSRFLIRELEKIESCDLCLIWRWHIREDEFNFLAKNVGKVVQFPEFKSMSLKKKRDGLFFKVITSENSRGKKIYKHINKAKSESEQEVLFLPHTKFLITGVTKDIIEMKEANESETDIYAEEGYELK